VWGGRLSCRRVRWRIAIEVGKIAAGSGQHRGAGSRVARPLCRRVRRTGRERRVDGWIAGGERRKCAHKDKLVPGPEAPRCRRKRSRGDRFRSSRVNRPARHSYRLPKNSPKDRAPTNTKSAASAMLELVAELHSAEGEATLLFEQVPWASDISMG
jgi:hypothetical protein